MSSNFVLRVGDYVSVDPEHRSGSRDSEGGTAYISSFAPSIGVKYVVSGRISPNVNRSRIKTKTLATVGRRRGQDGGQAPSIIDYSYPEYCRQQQLIATFNQNLVNNFLPTHQPALEAIINNRYLLTYALEKKIDIVATINKMNYTKGEGWLRTIENLNEKRCKSKNTCLLLEEKKLVVKLLTCLKMVCRMLLHKWQRHGAFLVTRF